MVIAASYWGKFKTTFQMIMVIMLIADIDNVIWQTTAVVITYIALVLTIVSLVDYIMKNKEVMMDRKTEDGNEG